MILTPADVPARPDLDWLRHRTRRAPGTGAAEPATTSTRSEAATGGLADFLAGRTTRRQPAPAPTLPPVAPTPAPAPVTPPAPGGDLDLGTSAADPLDLSGPPAARPTPPPATPPPATPPGGDSLDLSSPPTPAVAPGGDLLDLSAPTPPTPSPAPSPTPSQRTGGADLDLGSSDLDLSGPAPRPAPSTGPDLDLSGPPPAAAPPGSADLDLFPEAPAGPRTPTPAPRSRAVVRTVPRVAPGGRVVLTPREPTVTLDRVQSGVGALTVTAVCSPAVGDLVLGAVYQLADGSSGVLGRTAGVTTAPPRSRRPVLEAGRGEYDQIRVDLRQARSLRRFVVHAISASESALAWGGTLLLTTHGGSRVEIPLDLPPHLGPVVVASVYVVDGEFVVRAELDPVPGLVRDVAQAYGFRSITWADARTPVL